MVMENFKIIDFKFAKSTDKFDSKYQQSGAWSRVYEYIYVIDFIKGKKIKDFSIPKIHNSSWGYEGVHVIFRDELDTIGECLHSDICKSEFRETYEYNITTEKIEFENKFDFVVNISTIEHLTTKEERLNAIENLFKQVKVGGYLILTFDYPRVDILEIETLLGVKFIEDNPETRLNGENSLYPNIRYKDLNIVYLILEKNV